VSFKQNKTSSLANKQGNKNNKKIINKNLAQIYNNAGGTPPPPPPQDFDINISSKLNIYFP
jgi:hypothetical protein